MLMTFEISQFLRQETHLQQVYDFLKRYLFNYVYIANLLNFNATRMPIVLFSWLYIPSSCYILFIMWTNIENDIPKITVQKL